MVAEADTKYAGITRRFVAYILDYYLFMLLLLGIAYPVSWVVERHIYDTWLSVDSPTANGLALQFTLFLLYCAIGESSRYQATLGKKLMGIGVTDVSGNAPAFFKALIRAFAPALVAIPGIYIFTKLLGGNGGVDASNINLLLVMLGMTLLISAILSPRKQGLHDKLAKCLVIHR